MILAIDTETTGFREGERKLVQFGYALLDVATGQIVKSGRFFVQPYFDERREYAEARKRNRISREQQYRHGIAVYDAFGEMRLVESYNYKYLVSHNLRYDSAVLAEFESENGDCPGKIDIVARAAREGKARCSMLASIDFCDLPKKKYPRLEELCSKLGVDYNEEYAHDAMYDAVRCAVCSLQLLNFGLIK